LFLLRHVGEQAAGVSSPIIFSRGKKQMVNSIEKHFFFLELVLIKDVLEVLTESGGVGVGKGRRTDLGEVAAEEGQAKRFPRGPPPGAGDGGPPQEPSIWWGHQSPKATWRLLRL
jgi:hypothetical protein